MNVNIMVLRNIGALQWATRTDVSEEPAASICTMTEETIRFSEILELRVPQPTRNKFSFFFTHSTFSQRNTARNKLSHITLH